MRARDRCLPSVIHYFIFVNVAVIVDVHVLVDGIVSGCVFPALPPAGSDLNIPLILASSTSLGSSLSLVWILPFALMLGSIAVFPLVLGHWWEVHWNKLVFAVVLGAPVFYLYLRRNPEALLETLLEFLSFITLLASLYVVAGGVLMTGDLRATPQTNTAFLAAGAILASLIGTTGASLLLIRPVLQTNAERTHKKHTVIFFIFLVSNIGGCLTPLGDPPLFVGYLEGVPFVWTLTLWKEWLGATLLVLLVYFIWDSVMFSREPTAALMRDKLQIKPLRLLGLYNFVFMLIIILSVAFLHAPYREGAMLAAAGLCLVVTPAEIRKANRFTYYPIIEVLVIFFGIFLTMIPALDILRARAGELGIVQPWQFFWAVGGLSSFLDNTPTYLVFLNIARGLNLANEIAGVSEAVLRAISLGAVFMGANTYIGNAPNFMVRSVAQESGLKMPSFFGYTLYSAGILLPIFAVLTLVFF